MAFLVHLRSLKQSLERSGHPIFSFLTSPSSPRQIACKLTLNPNVMVEYGYALRSLTFEAMMPVMNTHYGAPTELPFDLGHVRHPNSI